MKHMLRINRKDVRLLDKTSYYIACTVSILITIECAALISL